MQIYNNKIKIIFKFIETELNIKKKALIGKTRHQDIIKARIIFVYLAKNIEKIPYTVICRYLNKDRTTLMYYMKVLENYVNIYKNYDDFLNYIVNKYKVYKNESKNIKISFSLQEIEKIISFLLKDYKKNRKLINFLDKKIVLAGIEINHTNINSEELIV